MDRLDLQLCREIITASNCPELVLSRERCAPKQREIINDMTGCGPSEDEEVTV